MPKKTKDRFQNILRSPEMGTVLIIILLSTALTVLRAQFLTATNLAFVARGFSFIAISAIGMCFVLITGGIDLSVGSVMGVSGVTAAYMCAHGGGFAAAVVVPLLVGCLFGLFNGVLIAKAKIPPFIITLGTMNIGRGLVYIITGGWPMQGFTKSMLFLGQGYLFGFPMPLVILAVLLVVSHFALSHTTFGWNVYALGGNEEAARLSGISVDRMKIGVYVLSGLLSAVAGVLLTARLGVGETTVGMNYEMNVIAAVVIGGVSMSGGVGTVLSALLGATLMGVLNNGLVLLGVSAFWQQIVIGTVIILAVLMDRVRISSMKRGG